VWHSPLGRAIVILLGVLTLAALFSAAPLVDALAALWDWRMLMLCFVALALFDDVRAQRAVAVTLVAAAVLAVLVLMVLQQRMGLTRDANAPQLVLLRNNVTQAMFIAVGAYLACMLLATRQFAGRGAQVALGLAALVLLLRLLFVETGRSGHLLLLVAFVASVVLGLHGLRRWVALLFVPLAAVLVYSASPQLQARFGKGIAELTGVSQATELTSMGVRQVMWRGTMRLIQERPVRGYGLGAFSSEYSERAKALPGWRGIASSDPHNQYLFLWVEAGLAGVFAFAWWLIAATRQVAAPPYRNIGLALLAGWCATSLFSSHFQTFNEGHQIALLLGVFLAVPASQDRPSVPKTAPRTAA
jgi:O-antigen ligase